MTRLAPTDAANRTVLLDALRGFALLGIMFVNMTWFTGFAVLSDDQKAALGTEAIDKVVYWLIQVLVDGKFWSIFALLFGVGVAMQHRRAIDSGSSFARIYVWRVSVLFLIGMAHAIFLWFGDIVSLYAVAGLALLLFLRRSDKFVLISSIVLLGLPVVQLAIWLLIHLLQSPNTVSDPGYGPTTLLPSFAEGTYREAFAANWAFLLERWQIAIYDGRFLKLMGMFLLGWLAGRHRVFEEPQKHRTLLIQLLTVGLVIGLPANVLAFSAFPGVSLRPPSFQGWIVEALKAVGVPLLSLAWLAATSIALTALRDRKTVSRFAAVGRMSLTNYVMQSVIGIAIFYGCGAGLWGTIGVTWSLALIAVIFGLQSIISELWLCRFRHGPLEWIWRCLTYRRLLPLRSESASSGELRNHTSLERARS